LLEAVSFAARAHRHQTRKDGRTPYAAHVFRVCLIVRQVFGIDDPNVLTAAVLHDAIEDTPTDFDDLEESFGRQPAEWAAALCKDMRLPEAQREREYVAHLAAAPWQVKVCKLADIYDNTLDSRHLTAKQRERTRQRGRTYLDAIGTNLPSEAQAAYDTVQLLFNQVFSAGP
jgi:guanosine-3',5'-bis(diphosphate) 3'-pyrophosphohydrolase